MERNTIGYVNIGYLSCRPTICEKYAKVNNITESTIKVNFGFSIIEFLYIVPNIEMIKAIYFLSL